MNYRGLKPAASLTGRLGDRFQLALLLDEVQAIAKEQGRYFMVVVIPKGNDGTLSEVEQWAFETLMAMIAAKRIPTVTSEEIFKSEGYTPTRYRNGSDAYLRETPAGVERLYSGGHFLPEGYAYLAQGVKKALVRQGIIHDRKVYSFRWDHEKDVLVLRNTQDPVEVKIIVPYEQRT